MYQPFLNWIRRLFKRPEPERPPLPHTTHKLNRYLVCYRCGTEALNEGFLGEFGKDGYECVECIKKLNVEIVRDYLEK